MQPGTSAAIGLLVLAGVVGAAPSSVAQPQGAAAETFTATATVKTGAGSAATAPVTIVVSRKMTDAEADSLKAAFRGRRTGGAAQGTRRRASHRFDSARRRTADPTRLTLERTTGAGRLLTIVTDSRFCFSAPDSLAPSRRPATTSA
jgi:hypothetical protein